MKKALSIWCFAGGTGVLDAMRAAKRAGFDGIELAFAEEGAARARQYMGDPGYQDTPQQTRPAFDPFRRFAESAGFRVPGSDWEVLDPDQPAPPQESRRVYQDEKGNRIVVDWRDGPQ